MSGNLVTVEQAAQQLKLHPKTVLRYIREGRLRATRIGKAYRITHADLDAFAGQSTAGANRATGARATCIVDVPEISAEAANRIAMYLGAATMSAESGLPPLHVRTAFDPAACTLKVVVIGEPTDVARVLELFQVLRGERS